MKTIYSVVEFSGNSDEVGNEQITSEYFGEDREGAINYLQSHLPFVKSAYRDWQYECGLNSHTWTKGKETHKFYLKMLDVNEETLKMALQGRR